MEEHTDEIALRHRPRLGPKRIPKKLAKATFRLLAGSKGIVLALAVLACGYLAFTNYGFPALHFSYDYQVGLGTERFKAWCRYLSLDGVYERAASGGQCSWIVMAPRVKN